MIRKFNAFDTFYEYKVNVNDEVVKQIKIIFAAANGKDDQLTTFYHLNILNLPVLKSLRDEIINILNEHKILLTSSWAQLYNKKDRHSVHVHQGSRLSGIIYLSDNCTPTSFYDRVFNSYEHIPTKNTLLLFPSYVPHEVKPLIDNENRLIISFNTTDQVSASSGVKGSQVNLG
tara:strand:+ start:1171 stop:1692 length:522 start_codon:yes stop_codon:yes gene_type:complete